MAHNKLHLYDKLGAAWHKNQPAWLKNATDFITRQNFTTAQIAASRLPLHFLAIAFIGAIC